LPYTNRQEEQLVNTTQLSSTTATAPSQAPEPPLTGRRCNRRLQRIDDYQRASLADPDALAANVGAIGSDLMKMEYRLMKAINGALARSPDPIGDFATLLPAIETCAQVTRQIFRLADLSYRLRGARTSTSFPPSPVPAGTALSESVGPMSGENRN
jgi:hypothetical protein